MTPSLHQLAFDGATLVRGYWLYIWEITVSDGRTLHYVGKTGDKASGVSQSPFHRLSAHLGKNKNSNALMRHLRTQSVEPEECYFRFYACGPLLIDGVARSHGESCDIMSGLEKALADAMTAAGYTPLNTVNCRLPVNSELFSEARGAFAASFPKLTNPEQES